MLLFSEEPVPVCGVARGEHQAQALAVADRYGLSVCCFDFGWSPNSTIPRPSVGAKSANNV